MSVKVNKMNNWVVEIKGKAGAESFEIAVLRKNNEHGKSSFGWFGIDKLLITHNGEPCHWPLTQKVWDKQIILANEVANELNAEESK